MSLLERKYLKNLVLHDHNRLGRSEVALYINGVLLLALL